MIPKTGVKMNTDIVIREQPSKTYKVYFEDGRMSGHINGIDAVKQAVYKILSTERYQHLIYSWNYGIELADLFGRPLPYIYSELKRRITEALLLDRRITDVDSFSFEHIKNVVLVSFFVHSTEGDFEVVKEVSTNV